MDIGIWPDLCLTSRSVTDNIRTSTKGEWHMVTVKKEALRVISQLPAQTAMEDIMYRLYVIDKVRKGVADMNNGAVESHEKVSRDVSRW